MSMNWLEDLLVLLSNRVATDAEIDAAIDKAVHALGFEHYHFVYRQVMPFSKTRMQTLSNHPLLWRKRYAERGYAWVDPRLAHPMNTDRLFLWDDQLFGNAPELWLDLQKHGMRHGVTRSVPGVVQGSGILSLARSHPEISQNELVRKREKIRQLAQLIHNLYSRNCLDAAAAALPALSSREAEVMRWTADGKSARDIAEILHLSKNTIDFHIKNMVNKMGTPNKTAAVILAASLGMI